MENKKDIKKRTKKRYIQELNNFLLTEKDIITYVEESIKDKKQLSKLKCALKNSNLQEKDEYIKTIKPYFYKKPKYKKKIEEQFNARSIENAINRMKNRRLKIAFRLQLISGLRVNELSELKLNDLLIEKESKRLIIHVREGKYLKERYVKCLYDKWVYNEILEIEERKEKLFYSKSYLMQIAKKLNFHTHDLRKTFAQIKYYNNVSENAVEELQKDLGQCIGTKTYLKYINRDINLCDTRWDKIKPFEENNKTALKELQEEKQKNFTELQRQKKLKY